MTEPQPGDKVIIEALEGTFSHSSELYPPAWYIDLTEGGRRIVPAGVRFRVVPKPKKLEVGDTVDTSTADEPPVGTVLESNGFVIGRNKGGWWDSFGTQGSDWSFFDTYTVIKVAP